MNNFKYGDQVHAVIRYQDGGQDCELWHDAIYTFLCFNTQGKAVLENPGNDNGVFLAAHIRPTSGHCAVTGRGEKVCPQPSTPEYISEELYVGQRIVIDGREFEACVCDLETGEGTCSLCDLFLERDVCVAAPDCGEYGYFKEIK